MSIRNVISDLQALKSRYSGRDLGRIQSAIDSLNAIGSAQVQERRSYESDYASYNYNDRTMDGCPDCRPGRPCYGHGH